MGISRLWNKYSILSPHSNPPKHDAIPPSVRELKPCEILILEFPYMDHMIFIPLPCRNKILFGIIGYYYLVSTYI